MNFVLGQELILVNFYNTISEFSSLSRLRITSKDLRVKSVAL
ncbi:MAG: hypothetical protein NZ601_06280 [candidate division WOR-3 bacterium]|nr:hypothetical protein [candidate division WOR-3 bacterium]MDW7987578.1 hypothetical protein [candidate division WOR-3 bacterium]